MDFWKTTALLSIASSLAALCACQKKYRPHDIDKDTPFEAGISKGVVTDDLLHEISGIVASRRYPGYYWVHNDSGGEPAVYMIDSNANKIAQVTIEGLTNRDWEDVAIGPGEKGGYSRLYVSETGDNRAMYGRYFIYSFEEPGIDLDNRTQKLFIDRYSTYNFEYPDGPRDAETLMVDPLNNDLLVVSKREPEVNIYLYPAAEAGPELYTLQKICSIPIHEMVAGEIAYSGSEILMKNYLSVFYWTRSQGEKWEDVFKRRPIVLPYSPEPQGEAIAFTSDGSGYVTIGEAEAFIGEQHLYFYKRIGASPRLQVLKAN